MKVLTKWDFIVEDGYLCCEGDFEGRGWITTPITFLEQKQTHYLVHTENSIYYLYW